MQLPRCFKLSIFTHHTCGSANSVKRVLYLYHLWPGREGEIPYTLCHPCCSYYLKHHTFKATLSTKKKPILAHTFFVARATDSAFFFAVCDLFFVWLVHEIISWISDCKNKVHFNKTSFTSCSVWRK